MGRRRKVFELFRETWISYQRDGGPLLGGAVAFFAILSAAPLVVVAVAIAGAVFGESVARGELRSHVESLLGQRSTEGLLHILEVSYDPKAGLLATLAGLVVLSFAASRVFFMLRLGLNLIWGVRVKPRQRLREAAATLARKRLISLGMVVLCGIALFVVLAAKTAFAAVDTLLGDQIRIAWAWRAVDTLVSLGVLTVVFASMYKVLPDVRIAWKDVWVGAVLTSLLMTGGSLLLGLYLGRVVLLSTYGAAGSLVLVLLWVYYSGQIFFFGAAFTEVWARSFGKGVVPEPHAERIQLSPPDEENAPPWLTGRPPE